ncbi:MAG TPA: AmmeMemoRadiSam system protein B [Deltaproteobacteria bacterium]|nr:AmmeMemoRadiSam system protein B [Deltaproteobacteria bacterium]
MKPCTMLLNLFLAMLVLFCCASPVSAHDVQVRKSIAAGTFYPASAEHLSQLIENYTRAAGNTCPYKPQGMNLRALIVPHAGYVYSGPTASYATYLLKGEHFSKVIVVGPDHRVGFEHASISRADAYETPLGQIMIHDDAHRLRKENPLFKAVDASDRSEHSIEVVLPFIQYALAEFSLVPIVLGSGDSDAYTDAIGDIIDNDTLLVISSDLSHYMRYSHAVEKDRETIGMILNLREDALGRNSSRACGINGIRVLVTLARQRGWKPMLLNYTNSGDTAGSKDSVVGYAAIAFYGGPMEKTFSEEQGQVLVKLAKDTIEKKLGMKTGETALPEDALKDEAFQTKRGVFVTLNRKGRLRGCIGSLEARDTVLEGVRRNAVNAAFHDPRFNPVAPSEMDDMEIEVSILTEPKPIEYTDYKDLLEKLRPGIDGVIIRSGYAGATFLPQVWDQLPDKAEFLSHLCAKAGMEANAWKERKLEVSTYQVQYFEEPE